MLSRFSAVAVCALVPSALADPAPAWRFDRFTDGLRVDVREVGGSAFEEVRVTTSSALPLKALCDAVWGKDQKASGDFLKRVVISETDRERWTYEQIRVPMITNRDCVMHVTLADATEQGRCDVDFETGAHPSWPAAKGFVRLGAVRGHWRLQRQTDGNTAITYTVFSDPGGSVPAFLTRGGQRDAAVSFLKTILARAQGK